MKATIELEIEANRGQTAGGLEAALLRGLVALKSSIEHGMNGSSAGNQLTPPTTKVEVVEKDIIG